MKKFKSLMLAALASAALAAPSFADGHMTMTGEVILGMQYSAVTPDGGDTTTVQKTYIGDINAKLTNVVTENAKYAVEFLKDDEGAGKISFEMTGTATSGDNSITAFADISDITNNSGTGVGYGDVYVSGTNKTLSLKVGAFGVPEYYYNGMGYYRASAGLTSSNQFTDDSENLLILGNRGLELGIAAGAVDFKLNVPFFTAAPGSFYALTSTESTVGVCNGKITVDKANTTTTYDAAGTATTTTAYACSGSATGSVATSVTGVRPAVSIDFGAGSVSAVAYSLNFAAQNGDDTVDKTDSGVQVQAKIVAGSATVGFGYTTQTKKNGATEVTPSVLNGSVKVGLGGGSNVGASFDVIGDGAETDETTATRFSASYDMPFFVEAVTLKLGVGTATQSSDIKAKAGSASGLEAEWVYNF